MCLRGPLAEVTVQLIEPSHPEYDQMNGMGRRMLKHFISFHQLLSCPCVCVGGGGLL